MKFMNFFSKLLTILLLLGSVVVFSGCTTDTRIEILFKVLENDKPNMTIITEVYAGKYKAEKIVEINRDIFRIYNLIENIYYVEVEGGVRRHKLYYDEWVIEFIPLNKEDIVKILGTSIFPEKITPESFVLIEGKYILDETAKELISDTDFNDIQVFYNRRKKIYTIEFWKNDGSIHVKYVKKVGQTYVPLPRNPEKRDDEEPDCSQKTIDICQ